MMKTVCCVNDMPGVGKIALSAMIPILSAKGISVTCLPTALVSNTLDFGKFDILDTSAYMDRTVDIWHQLGFRFDCIATGFMVDPKQVQTVEKLICYQGEQKPLVVVDPIMGDEGKLYNGMTQSNVEILKKLSGYADVLIPNFTEAAFLTDQPNLSQSLTADQARELLDRCRGLGAKSVVITSCCVDGQSCVIGYDHTCDSYFQIPFARIDVRFPGTGDIFSAVMIADLMGGQNLQTAVEHAMQVVSNIILDNMDKQDRFFGVDIERFISEGKL